MKQLLRTAWLLPLALNATMLIAQSDPQTPAPQTENPAQQEARQTVSGKIGKSDYGKYILVDSQGTMYQLDDQTSAKKYAGKKVTVSGTVDTTNNVIHVAKITAES
jgi:hypothetical protein